MKLQDAHIGMEVVDKFGNEYVIISLDMSDMPVELECTKFVQKCYTTNSMMAFRAKGNICWINDIDEAHIDISLESITPKGISK